MSNNLSSNDYLRLLLPSIKSSSFWNNLPLNYGQTEKISPIVILLMLSPIHRLVFLCLLIGLSTSQQANCQIVADASKLLYVGNNETQMLRLSDYIKGYNLAFAPIDGLTPPFYRSDSQPLPPVPENYTLVSIDILSPNKAWSQYGAALFNSDDNLNSLVLFGNLNSNYNLKFKTTIKVTHETPTVCMDIVMVGTKSALIDCQDETGVDVVYLVELDMAVKVEMGPGVKVNGIGRKNIMRRTEQGVFVLSVILNSRVQEQSKGNTSVLVYNVDLENKAVRPLDPLVAKTFNREKLYLSDITIDSSGRIYVTDQKFGIYSFFYDLNKISSLYTNPIYNPLKISSFTTPSGTELYFIATNIAIVEAQWPMPGTLIPRRYYEIADGLKEIRDLQVNNFTLMVESQDSYYFYRLGEVSLRNLMYVVDSQATVGIMDQQSPQAIVVGRLNSIGYVITAGYLQVYGTMQKDHVLLSATSVSATSNKTCSILFQITILANYTQVYISRMVPKSQSTESPAAFELPIDQYLIGSRLRYMPLQSEGVYETVKFVDQYTVTGLKLDRITFIATYSVDSQKYYRVSKTDDTYTTEECTYNKNVGYVNCNVTKIFRSDGNIFAYGFFQNTLGKLNKAPFMAFVTQTTPNTIQFQALVQPPAPTPTPSPLPLPYPISQLACNPSYILATVRDPPQIHIFSLPSYLPLNVITSDSFNPTQMTELVRFRPRSVTLSPANPNVVFIKNLQSVILMKFSATGLLWINNIRVLDVADNTIQWEVVVTKNRMAVVVKQNNRERVVEYGLEDVYRPVKLKDLNVMGDVFSETLKVGSAVGSDIILVNTVKNDSPALSFYKLSVPLIQSNYHLLPNIPSNSLVALTPFGTSLILQIFPPNSPIKTLLVSPRPLLSVTANSTDPSVFKQNMRYGVMVYGEGSEMGFIANLTLFNYQRNIVERNVSNDQIDLPETADKVWVEITEINQMFNGSVRQYQLGCSYCDNSKITLVDHLHTLGKATGMNEDVVKVINLKEVSMILALTPSSVNTYYYNTTLAKSATLPYTCSNLVQYSNSTAILICSNTTNQFFVPISIPSLTLSPKIVISDNYYIRNPLKMLLLKPSNQLMVLDNTIQSDGEGKIRVFVITTKGQDKIDDIQPFGTIGSLDFQCDHETLINDVSLLNTTKVTEDVVFVVTLKEVGIGYGVYNTEEGWGQGAYVDLTTEEKVLDYTLDDNTFLQVLVLNGDKNTNTEIKNTIILTMSSGAHLEVIVTFSNINSKWAYNGLEVLNSFNRYGKQTVLNTAMFQPTPNNNVLIGWLAVLYLDPDQNTLTYGLYEIPVSHQPSPINFKTSHHLTNISLYTFTPTYTFHVSSTQLHLVSPSPPHSLSFSNLSSKAYMMLSYTTPDLNCTSIKITAVNDYSTCDHQQAVKFAGDSESQGWYVWVLAVLGSLFMVGVVYGLYRFVRRKMQESKRVSLLTEDEERV